MQNTASGCASQYHILVNVYFEIPKSPSGLKDIWRVKNLYKPTPIMIFFIGIIIYRLNDTKHQVGRDHSKATTANECAGLYKTLNTISTYCVIIIRNSSSIFWSTNQGYKVSPIYHIYKPTPITNTIGFILQLLIFSIRVSRNLRTFPPWIIYYVFQLEILPRYFLSYWYISQ